MSTHSEPGPQKKLIEPKILQGFRDILPVQERSRRDIITILEKVVQSFGFVPIDTPVLEYTEVLLGKGGGETDKQIYRFEDNGGRDVSMRFDLTVPFARFMAAHRNELYLPFKRYHFAKVWRGEKAQRGRYREFMQCDFDIVGVDSLGADFEILQLMDAAFAALGVRELRFHVSHRGIFNRFLDHNGLAGESSEILRIVDKLKKIGPDETLRILGESTGPEKARKIIEFVRGAASNTETLDLMESLSGGPSEESERMRGVLRLAGELGMESRIVLDPSITRGLDYYTGIVYETFLTELPDLGSVCSGGRYNNLASLYTKEDLPGVGTAIGLDRLIAGLEELGTLKADVAAATVLVLCQDEDLLSHYYSLAARLRAEGIPAEVYLGGKKLGQQFAYAEKKGIPFGIIVGQSEFESGTLNLKNLGTRESWDSISFADALARLKA